MNTTIQSMNTADNNAWSVKLSDGRWIQPGQPSFTCSFGLRQIAANGQINDGYLSLFSSTGLPNSWKIESLQGVDITEAEISLLAPVAEQAGGLKALAKRVYDQACDMGWHEGEQTEDQFIERCCNNLHDEVSELHTAWREGNLNNPCDKADKMFDAGLPALTCKEEELADIVIRALDDASYLGVDIARAVDVKLKFNLTRGHRHGNKKS